jgi:hypothetical protein
VDANNINTQIKYDVTNALDSNAVRALMTDPRNPDKIWIVTDDQYFPDSPTVAQYYGGIQTLSRPQPGEPLVLEQIDPRSGLGMDFYGKFPVFALNMGTFIYKNGNMDPLDDTKALTVLVDGKTVLIGTEHGLKEVALP